MPFPIFPVIADPAVKFTLNFNKFKKKKFNLLNDYSAVIERSDAIFNKNFYVSSVNYFACHNDTYSEHKNVRLQKILGYSKIGTGIFVTNLVRHLIVLFTFLLLFLRKSLTK